MAFPCRHGLGLLRRLSLERLPASPQTKRIIRRYAYKAWTAGDFTATGSSASSPAATSPEESHVPQFRQTSTDWMATAGHRRRPGVGRAVPRFDRRRNQRGRAGVTDGGCKARQTRSLIGRPPRKVDATSRSIERLSVGQGVTGAWKSGQLRGIAGSTFAGDDRPGTASTVTSGRVPGLLISSRHVVEAGGSSISASAAHMHRSCRGSSLPLLKAP